MQTVSMAKKIARFAPLFIMASYTVSVTVITEMKRYAIPKDPELTITIVLISSVPWILKTMFSCQ